MITGKKPKAATFKLVLERAEADQSWDYLCFRIGDLSNSGLIDSEQAHVCTKYIEQMLYPSTTYPCWVKANHTALYDKVSFKSNGHLLLRREGRIAWLRHIITVLES